MAPWSLGCIQSLEMLELKKEKKNLQDLKHGADLSFSPCGKTDYIKSVSFVLIDVVNQYTAWFASVSCSGITAGALNHTTLHTLL